MQPMQAASRSTTWLTATNPSDAVNLQQLQSAQFGLKWKDPVRALIDAPITLATGVAAGTIHDGVTLALGDRILPTAQATAAENGIYEVTAGAPVRPADYPAGSSAANVTVFVSEGTTYADTQHTCTTDPPSDIVDTDGTTWAQTGGGATVTAGDGLTLTGVVLDVVAANASIVANPDSIEVGYGLVGDVQEVGSANAAGTSDLAARADHVHAHGDQSAAGGTHHTAAQITIAGALPTLGNPANEELAWAALEALLLNPQLSGKTLQVSSTRRVPQFRACDGWSSAGCHRRLSVSGCCERARSRASRCRWTALMPAEGTRWRSNVNGVITTATLVLGIGVAGAEVVLGAPVAYAAGDTISVALRRTTGSGPSSFGEITALVEYTEVV